VVTVCTSISQVHIREATTRQYGSEVTGGCLVEQRFNNVGSQWVW